MTDYPYLYYVNDFSGGVCVKECPKLENLTDPKTLVTYSGLFQVDGSYITTDDIAMADYSYNNDTLACTETLCYPNNDPEQLAHDPGVGMDISHFDSLRIKNEMVHIYRVKSGRNIDRTFVIKNTARNLVSVVLMLKLTSSV